jgi:hypothetical protein
LRRFAASHQSPLLNHSTYSIRSPPNLSRRSFSSNGKPSTSTHTQSPNIVNRSGSGFQSFRERRSERMRQTNAASGWLIATVAVAGGTISAVVMAYTEGAQSHSPVQYKLRTEESESSVQFVNHGKQCERALQVVDDDENSSFHAIIQDFNAHALLDFEDYIFNDDYTFALLQQTPLPTLTKV